MSHVYFFFFKQKTAYEMRISDWSSDVCSSDLGGRVFRRGYRELDAADLGLVQDVGRDDFQCSGRRMVRAVAATSSGLSTTRSTGDATQIGRASCRERVCQYV